MFCGAKSLLRSSSALAVLKYLKDNDSGRAGVLLGGHEYTVDTASWPSLPEGATGFGVRLLNRMVAEKYEG